MVGLRGNDGYQRGLRVQFSNFKLVTSIYAIYSNSKNVVLMGCG